MAFCCKPLCIPYSDIAGVLGHAPETHTLCALGVMLAFFPLAGGGCSVIKTAIGGRGKHIVD